MAKSPIKRYSLSFKKQVVQEYESGEPVSQLMSKYGVASAQSIYTWIKQYSPKGSRPVKEIKDAQSQAEIESLKGRIANLEKLVTQLSLDKFMLESCVAVAEQELGYELKKREDTPSSKKPKKGSRKSR